MSVIDIPSSMLEFFLTKIMIENKTEDKDFDMRTDEGKVHKWGCMTKTTMSLTIGMHLNTQVPHGETKVALRTGQKKIKRPSTKDP
mgnify:CR=1 FL=1